MPVNYYPIQVNDHKVYTSYKNPYPFERIGILIKHNPSNYYEFNPMYIAENGEVHEICDRLSESENFHFIANKGEKCVPRNFAHAISANISENMTDFESLMYHVEEYCPIDKSKAEDTIKLRIDAGVCGENNFRLDVYSDWYSFGEGPIFFNFKNENYKCEDKDNYGLDVFCDMLASYIRYLEKSINIDIDFDVDYDNFMFYRNRYLDKIRKYIVDTTSEKLEEDDTMERWKAREKRIKLIEDNVHDHKIITISNPTKTN